MDLEIDSRVLVFTHFKGKPVFLPGLVRQVMTEMGHVGVLIRKDYRGLVDGNTYVVVPKEFVFSGDILSANNWINEIDRALNSFTTHYDGSDEAWAPAPLTWQAATASLPSQTDAGA